MEFLIFDLKFSAQKNKWLSVWDSWGSREIHAHPDFIKLNAFDEDEVLAFYTETKGGGILFPIIKRKISSESWCDVEDTYFDVITPYGYGGAFCWGTGECHRDYFWEEYKIWCKKNNVVTSFIRQSLFKDQVLRSIGEISSPYKNIVRRLNVSEEDLFNGYKHSVRKNLKRAISSGLEIEVDLYGKKLNDFLTIYNSTMDRVDAQDQYYFSEEYFKGIINKLRGYFVFFHVRYKEKIIATELVLVSSKSIYSFLGGTIAEYNSMRPNNFLKHEIIKWGTKNGKLNFILGGGYKKDDGIFKYKKAMAPDGEYDFYLAKVIHDPEAFQLLVLKKLNWKKMNAKTSHIESDFFPSYRG